MKPNAVLPIDPRQVTTLLSYYFFVPIDMPVDFQVNMNKEYLANLKTITWVNSLKDVYHKFLHSSRNPEVAEDDMAMPCFYIRGASFYAMFRIEEQKIVAELVPSPNLQKELKLSKCVETDSLGTITHQVKTIYDDEPVKQETKADSDDEGIDSLIGDLAGSINYQRPEDLRT